MNIEQMERSIKVFRRYVEKDDPFPKDLHDIVYWENVLYDWIVGLPTDGDHLEVSMEILTRNLQDLFPYDRMIYRGAQLLPNEVLAPRMLASFSSYDEVALFFAGNSKVYGGNESPGRTNRFYIETSHPSAFALGNFLEVIRPKIISEGFAEVIDDRLWESEVIAPLTEEMISTACPMASLIKPSHNI